MLTARADRDRAVASPSKYEVANEGFIGDQKARQAMLHKEQVPKPKAVPIIVDGIRL
jgi:hypothetical protein